MGAHDVRVVVADDHSIVRESLKQYVLLLDDMVRIDDAESLRTVLEYATAEPPIDLILLDLQMPGMRGPVSVSRVRESFPTTFIVVVSAVVDREKIVLALRAGANGYIPKATTGQALLNAIRLVLAGETYVPPLLFDGHRVSAIAVSKNLRGQSHQTGKLSLREADVLENVISGKTNKNIALDLGLQEATVKVHIRNIYRKIGATSRNDAINIIARSGGLEAWLAEPRNT